MAWIQLSNDAKDKLLVNTRRITVASGGNDDGYCRLFLAGQDMPLIVKIEFDDLSDLISHAEDEDVFHNEADESEGADSTERDEE